MDFYLVIVNNDKPIFEYPIKEDRYLKQFIAYSSLDIVDEMESQSNNMYFKNIDKFNEWNVHAYVPNRLRILLLVNSKLATIQEAFFQELYQIYCKFALNPLYIHNSPIKSAAFERKASQIARKYLQ